MSVPVGFFQASTSLIVPAAGATASDGIAAEGSDEAGLFAALLAMLAPGAMPADNGETTTPATATFAAATTAVTTPPSVEPAVAAPKTPETPQLTDLQQSEAGKVLLKDFTDALKAAKTALDEGRPLEPALEKKLRETADAIAAWFAGQPQLAGAPADIGRLAELASGSNVLPAAPAADLPPAPTTPTDKEDAGPAPTPVEPPSKRVQAQIVPLRLAEFGHALADFATQLEKASPELASVLSRLADRITVGDVSEDALAQLGLTRTPASTSPEVEQLVAALTAKPVAKPAAMATTATTPIAAPVLDLPETLAGPAAAATAAPEAKPQAPVSAIPDASAEPRDGPQPANLSPTADLDLDAEISLAGRPAQPRDEQPVADARPFAVATPAPKVDTPSPVAVAAESPAPVVPAAATATRAIHAAYSAPVQQLNYPQVAFEVARQFEAGNTRFQIRLDPADLGRIDVRLDLDKSGTVSAHLFVERPETLDLMMRDQRALQQALQQAGLDGSKTSLEFSLRQNPFGAGADTGQGNGGDSRPGFGPFGTPTVDDGELAAQPLYRGSATQSGLNLFV